MLMGEWMHNMDLGVAPNLLGSCFWELTHGGPWKGSAAIKTKKLWGLIQKGYEKHKEPSRMNQLQMSHFTHTDSWAVLHAKAAHCRALVPIVYEILQELTTEHSPNRYKHRLEAFKHLSTVYRVVMKGGMYLSDTEHAEMQSAWDAFMLHYNHLSKLAIDRGEYLYNMTIKFHYGEHLVLSAKFQNPKFLWSYIFEDFLGKFAICLCACSQGSKVVLVGKKGTDSYCLAFLLRKLKQRRNYTHVGTIHA
jgi:hypothetical protein